MNLFLTNDCNRTGKAGIVIDTGKGKKRGASRAINLDHNNKDRNYDVKGNSNINRDLRFSSISNRFNNNKGNLRLRNQNRSSSQDSSLRFSSQDSSLRRRFSSNKDNPRLSSQDNNLRRRFSNNKDKSKGLKFSSSSNTLSLKENLKEGTENIESRMTEA